MNKWEKLPNSLKFIITNVMMAFAYNIFAKLGLLLAFDHNQVSPLWPPSGLAIAAVIICGRKYILGIYLGATITHILQIISAGNGLLFAMTPGLILGAVNTLEAVVGVWLFQKVTKSKFIFNNLKGVLLFPIFCGLAGCFVAALVGVITLTSFGLAPNEVFFKLLFTWWGGDLGGVLAIAPVFITYKRYKHILESSPLRLELGIYILIGSILSYFIFNSTIHTSEVAPTLLFLIIPFIVAAAMRTNHIGVAFLNLTIIFFATLGTVNGLGPFAASQNSTVLLLNIFIVSIYVVGFSMTNLWNNIQSARLEVLQNAKLAGLGEIASVMAHEIGNPVNLILNYSEIIKREITEGNIQTNEKVDRALDRIMKNVNRTQEIVKTTKNFYQNQKINQENVDLKVSCEKVLDLLSIKTLDSVISIDINCPNDVNLKADPLYIEQAIYNIINNSVRAFETDEGSEIIGKKIVITIDQNDNYAELQISDNGPGIHESVINKIFTPFYTTNSDEEGSGLGLSLVASIVAAHHGDVFAIPNDDRGITFKIRLPIT
ncbi:MAG: MASE1 domain-containing protein [Bacteriovoracaceae bacterium]|nr:MASE1 domain-containing protein [Bacteriovoracaceae bacterium]